MSLQQALGHVGVPEHHRRRDQLWTETGRRQQDGDHARRTPTGEPERHEQDELDHQSAVDHGAQRCDQRVLGNGAGCGVGESEGGVGQVRARRADGVAQQEVAGAEQRSEDQQCQRQAVRRRQVTAVSGLHCHDAHDTWCIITAMPRQPLDRAAAAGVGMVLVGSMTANVASYLLAWLASRWLGPVGYGEFASLLAAQLVLAVPALALQTVVAREAVRGKSTDALRSLGYRCTAIVAVLAVALAPAMAWLLDTGIVASFSALVTAPMLVLLATEQGLLQGHGRFGTLSAVLAGAGVMKVLPAVIVLAFGGGAGAALVAGAAGTALLVAIVRVVDRTVSVSEDRAVRIGVVSVLAASQVQLALIALSSLDLLIVRVVLSEYDAGVYALGAVATKVAFWLPQAVGVVLYPKMANPAHSAQAVRSALAVLVGIGAVLVLGAAVAGPLVPMLVGDAYAAVAPMLWAFALHGAALAVLQGALLSAIASERTRVALLAWAGLVVEATVMLVWAKTPGELIGVAVVVASTTALAVSVAAVRSADRARPAPHSDVSSPDA